MTLTVATSVADAGWIEVQIDRFDTLTGWQFNRLYRLRAPGGTVTWIPPPRELAGPRLVSRHAPVQSEPERLRARAGGNTAAAEESR